MHHDDVPERPDPCLIVHGAFRLQIMMAELKRVKIHEEVIPELRKSILDDIAHSRILKDPVMMDAKTYTIMDGMHRVAALRDLETRYIPVCSIDYSAPEVEVHRWYRSLSLNEELNEERIQRLGFGVTSVNPRRAVKLVNGGEVAATLIGKKVAYIFFEDFKDTIEASWVVKKIEGSLRATCKMISYDVKRDAYSKLEGGSIDYILCYPPVDKRSVVESASQRRLFAHKSTRHVFPARPLGVDISLDMLRSDQDPRSVNKELRLHLSDKQLIPRGRNQVIDGRRYEEDIYILR